jgi:adenosylhomocysteine nucleosidase
MEIIGLIAAMTQERDALLRLFRGVETIRLGSDRCHRFKISGQECVLITSGMGIRRAGRAAQSLVEAGPPRLFISFGIAGAVEPELEIGDVVAATAFCKLERDGLSPVQNLASLPDQPCQDITRVIAGRGARFFTGTAVSTSGSQAVELLEKLRHPVLEMETAGIARVANDEGIPLLSIRSISDGPRAPIPLNLDEMMDEDANLKFGKLIKAVFRHPGILLKARQMLRNSQIAADNAAIALVAALDWLSIHPLPEVHSKEG